MSISQSGEIAGEAFHKWRSDSDRLEGIEPAPRRRGWRRTVPGIKHRLHLRIQIASRWDRAWACVARACAE
jgi:hypothetical protein